MTVFGLTTNRALVGNVVEVGFVRSLVLAVDRPGEVEVDQMALIRVRTINTPTAAHELHRLIGTTSRLRLLAPDGHRPVQAVVVAVRLDRTVIGAIPCTTGDPLFPPPGPGPGTLRYIRA